MWWRLPPAQSRRRCVLLILTNAYTGVANGKAHLAAPGTGLARSGRSAAPHLALAVNFSALPIRLINTCWMRSLSMSTRWGSSGARSKITSTGLSPGCRHHHRHFGADVIQRAAGGSITSLPASILEKSKISFSSPSRTSARRLSFVDVILLAQPNWVCRTSCNMPSTAFIGVRISWLILAKNWFGQVCRIGLFFGLPQAVFQPCWPVMSRLIPVTLNTAPAKSRSK